MDYLILKDTDGGTCALTTYSPQSHYGIPVLRIEAEDVLGDYDYGPADVIPGSHLTAADIVAAWGRKQQGEKRAAADSFLRQWPNGPQL